MGQLDNLLIQAQAKFKGHNITAKEASVAVGVLASLWLVRFLWKFASVRMVSTLSLPPSWTGLSS